MIQFYETPTGRKFFEYQLPQLINAINRLADIQEKALQTNNSEELSKQNEILQNINDSIKYLR